MKEKIGEFLKTHLKLEQNEEKTLISHPTDTMKFLGYHLTSTGGRRKGLRLNIPKNAIDGLLSETERLCKLHHIPEVDLITKVNAKLRGWMNYYRYAWAPQRTFEFVIRKIFWQVSHYLAQRHRTSIPAIMQKHYRKVTKNGHTRSTLTKWMDEKPFDLWGFPPKTESIYRVGQARMEDDVKPLTVHEWATGRSKENRIEALEAADYQCSYCGTTEDVQVHHVGGLRGLQTAKQLSMAGQAKQKVTLCKSCHLEIGHHGTFAPRNRDKNVAYRETTAGCGVSESRVYSRTNHREGSPRATMLSETDYQEAVRRYKNMKGNGHERQRYHALLLVHQGYSHREVAEILLVDEDTVGRWVRQYQERGLGGTTERCAVGRRARAAGVRPCAGGGTQAGTGHGSDGGHESRQWVDEQRGAAPNHRALWGHVQQEWGAQALCAYRVELPAGAQALHAAGPPRPGAVRGGDASGARQICAEWAKSGPLSE